MNCDVVAARPRGVTEALAREHRRIGRMVKRHSVGNDVRNHQNDSASQISGVGACGRER
jgi:hypothetical protein